jgi:autotransporter-associated beta strand protein
VRIAVTELEDRSVPDGTAPLLSFPSTSIVVNEGSLFTRNGAVLDLDNEAINLTTDVPGGTLTPNSFTAGTTTSAQNFTFGYLPLNGPLSFPTAKVTATDGPVNPLSNSAGPFSVTVNNVTPTIGGAANQVAIAGKPVQLNLGKLTDPGAEPSWLVEIDYDYDTVTPTFTVDTSYTITGNGSGKSGYQLSELNAGGYAAGTYTVAVRVTDDTATSTVSTFTVTVVSDVGTTFVNDDWAEAADTSGGGAGLQPGDTVNTGVGTAIWGYDAWDKIGDALAVTTTAGTTKVLAGTYLETLALSKSVSVLGPNVGIAGNGIRGAEAIIRPAASVSAVVTVTASNVTLQGLTIDGDAAAAGTPVYSGADANALYAITNGNTASGTAINNLVVRENVIQRVAIGVFANSDTDPTAGTTLTLSDGGVIDRNLFQDLGVFDFGYAITLRNEFNANITDNVMRRVYTGISINNNSVASAFRTVSGNDVQSYGGGLWVNQAYGTATPLTVANNTFAPATTNYLNNPLAPAANNLGILVTGGPGFVGATFTGNSISGHDYGLIVWGTNPGVTFGTGNTISGTGVGAYITNNVGFNPITSTALNLTATAASANLSGLAISGSTTTGVRVRGDSGGGTTTVTLGGGTTITGGASGTGVLLDGPNAKLTGDTLGDTQFAGFTGTSQFVSLANTAYAGNTITGTAASYNGTLGSALTRTSTPSGFEVENRITHYLDDATLGFVRTTPNTTFVTPAGGSIQRAINKSSISGGDTVFVAAGTYAENLTVDRGIALRGPNDTTSPNSGARLSPGVPEAIISGSGIGFQLSSAPAGASVTVAGFKLTGTGGTLQQQAAGAGGTTIVFEKNWAVGRGQMYVDDQKTGGGTTTLTVDDNRFVSSTGNAMQLIGTPGTNNFTNATVTNNVIDGTVFAGLNTDGLTASTISGNTFTNTVQQGVQVAGPAAGVTVQNNTFTNVNTGGDANRGAIRVSSAALGGAVTISGNSITGDAKNGIFINTTANLSGGSLTITGNTISDQSVAGIRHIGTGTASVTSGTITAPGGGAGVIVNGGSAVLNVTGGSVSGAGAFTGLSLVTGTLNVSGGTITGATTGIAVSGGTAGISGGTITGTTTGIDFTGGTATVGGVAFVGGTTDLKIGTTGLTLGAPNTFSGSQFFIDNLSPTNYDLTSYTSGQLGGLTNNFRIEDRMYHKLDSNASGLITWVANNVYVTTPGVGSTDSSIQGGIDAVPNASTGWTVNVEAGTYDLAATEANDFVMVNEDVTVHGAGAGSTTITRTAAAVGGQTYLFGVAANGVTIQGFTFATVRPFANDGILAQYVATGVSGTNADTGVFDELAILDNVFTASGTGGASVHTGGTGRGIPVALLDNSGTNHADVTLRGNWIKSGAEAGTGVDFTRGLWSFAPMLTVGGPNVADGNKFYGTFQSALMQFPSITPSVNSTMLIQNNTFTGNVAEVTEPNSNVNVVVTQNTFGIAFGTRGNFFVNHNYSAGATVTISQNLFTVADNTLGVFLGGSKNVTVEDNTFNAVAGATNFAYVVADSQFRNGANPLASVSNFVIQGNAFNGGTVAGGIGIALYNGNASVGFNGATIGGAGADANIFGANLSKFITLNNVRNPIMTPEAGGSPAFGPFSLDIDASGNTFDVGSGLQLPSAMTVGGKFALEQKLFHKPDATAVGLITVVPNAVYVPNTQTIQGGIDAVPDGSTGWTVTVEAGTFNENVIVNESVTLLGANAGVAGNGTRGAESVIRTAGFFNIPGPQTAPLTVVTVTANGVVIDGFRIDGNNLGVAAAFGGTLSSGANSDALYGINNSTSNNLTVQNNIVENTYIGVRVAGSGSALRTGNLITANLFQDVGAYDFGYAVDLRENAYADVTNNVMTRVHTGVLTLNHHLAGGPTGWTISGNTVSAYGAGVWANQRYSAASPLTISNNTITDLTAPNSVPGFANFDGKSIGLLVTTLQNAQSLTVTGNSITGMGFGVVLYNTESSSPVVLGGTNTIGGNAVGVYLTDLVGFNPVTSTVLGGTANNPTGVGKATLSGLTLAGNGTGVLVRGINTSTFKGVELTLTGTNTITGGSTGIVVDGPDAKLAGDTLGATSFGGQGGQYVTLSNGAYNAAANGGLVLDGSAASFDGVVGGSATLAQAFVIENQITHQIDDAAQGFVRLQANKAFVTAASPAGAIQRGINAEGITATGGTVYVQSGLYVEDVLVNVTGLTLLGEGYTTTTISGAIGGAGTTVTAAASDITVSGFTITREGNNTTDWNNPNLNSAGFAVQGSAFTNITVQNNSFYGNRTGIDLNNTGASLITVYRNLIDTNRTGMILRNSTNNVQVSENFITNNFTVGIVFLDASGGTNVPVQSAVGSKFFNNSISGNWYGQVVDRQTGGSLPAPGANPKDFNGNWFGTTSPSFSVLNSTEPGYAAQIPTVFGGTATAPGGQPDILGPASANIDFSPFLWTGTDTDLVTPGFQGDFTQLGVTTQGGDSDGGTDFRIAEAISYNGGSATVVHVLPGSYAEAVDLTRDVTVRLEGNATFGSLASAAGANRKVDLNGSTLTTGGDNSSTAFLGVFVGTGTSSVIKQGTGTFTVGGNSSGYTGSLVADAGTVTLTGTVGGLVNVNASGTLTGTGTVGGLLTNAGTVNPGGVGTTGTLTAGSYTQTAGGDLVMDVLSGPTPATDKLIVSATGTATLAGTLTLNGIGGTGTPDFATLKLIDNTNPAGGTTTGGFSNVANGAFVPVNSETFLFSNPGGDGNDVTLLKVPTSTPPGTTYADDDWAALPNGTVVDVDPIAAGVQPGYIGVDAYSKIQTAINATNTGGTIVVFAGTYTADSANLTGTQTLRLFTGAAVTLNGPISGPALSTINLNRGSLTAGDGTNTTLGSKITGAGPSTFVKQGGGTLTLTNPANDYKGSTAVAAGTLLAGTDEVIPDGSAVTVAPGAALNLAGYYETIGSLAGSGNVTLDTNPLVPGGLTVGTNNTNTVFAGMISGAGGVVKVGVGTQTFTAAQSYGGGTRIDSGTLKLSGSAAVIGAVDTGSGNLELNLTSPAVFANPVVGGGTVTVNNTGTTELTGTNTYSGGTIVNAGTLVVPDFSELGTGPLTANGSATVRVTQNQTTGRPFNLNGTSTLAVATGKTLTLNAAQLTGGFIDGPGVLATVGGTTLTGTTLQPSLAVTVGGADTLHNVGSRAAVTVAGTGVTLDGFTNLTGGRLTVTGTATAAGFSTQGEMTVDGTFTGTGPAGLAFGGGSVTVISATGLLDIGTADASVIGGLVRNFGAFGSGTNQVVANYGSRVSGTGTFGTVTTINGGVFAPGSSPGTATTNDLPVNGGGTLEFEISNAAGTAGQLSGWDLIVAQPTVFSPTSATVRLTATAGNKYTVRVASRLDSGDRNTAGPAANFDPTQPYAWKLVDGSHPNTTTTGAFDPNQFLIDKSGFANTHAGTFAVEQRDGGKNLYLVYTPVPVSQVAGVLINGTAIPSASLTTSRITSLTVSFNTNVAVDPGAFSITNGTTTLTSSAGGGLLVGVAGNVVTITFDSSVSGVEFGSLSDGIWALTTDLTKVRNGNNVAGTGTTVTNHIRRLFGDIDGNGQVNGQDAGFFDRAFGSITGQPAFIAGFDWNEDGQINGQDAGLFDRNFGKVL